MYYYDIQDMLDNGYTLRISFHALLEAYKEGLRGKDILHALFHGEIIERYPNRARILVLGPTIRAGIPIHVVCDYENQDEIVAVTAYIPNRPQWTTDVVRGSLRRPANIPPAFGDWEGIEGD
ncbi:MAG: DUF4258 domain-containing protein [Anaerolineae bacterium]|nr:DUF4258 domain-containing protein [Anaerolineae bacterium]